MLSRKIIQKLFQATNEELKAAQAKGEIGLCGGAVMCLVFQARESTKDVDAIFQPASVIRKAALVAAKKVGVSDDWLNDAAKMYFHADPPREPVMELSNLRVWAPSADYMLAMKCLAARFDTHDKDDVLFLIHYLELKSSEQIFKIISRYYPDEKVPAKTKFFIEEIMGD